MTVQKNVKDNIFKMNFNDENDRLTAEYSVGPLLYSPALLTGFPEKLRRFGEMGLRTAAFCLEDTIRDDMVEQAEENLVKEIKEIFSQKDGVLPRIFIRVRAPSQMSRLSLLLGESFDIVSGFILPKIDDETVCSYLEALSDPLLEREKPLYIMPIIENPSLAGLSSRYYKLERLKERLMPYRERIIGVRTGGNDFCKAFSLRSDINTTIYDLLPVAHLLSDIAAVFCGEFTVSAPVWNYFEGGGRDWLSGLKREMKQDRDIGFIGKTIIHPCQLAPVNEFMKVSREDHNDARLIASSDGEIQVVKSADGSRMYEKKIHSGWAEKILRLGEIYGIEEP